MHGALALCLASAIAPLPPAGACPVEELSLPGQPIAGSEVEIYSAFAASGASAMAGPSPVAFSREVVDPLVISNGHKPKALMDVDLDGDLDVVVRSNGIGIKWYEYPGWTAHVISPSGSGEDAAAADIDGDGDIDFCFSGNSNDPECIANPLNQGMDPRTTVWPATVLGAVGGVGGHDILLADIDQDTRMDEIHLYGIFFQDPIGTWNPVSANTILPGRGFKGTSIGDIDGDGDLDLVTPNAGSPNRIVWHENPLPGGDPRVDAWVSREIGPGAKAFTTLVADISGDGRPDVIASPLSEPPTTANGLVWFEGPVDPLAPGATWTERSIDPTVGFVHQGSIHAGDMNGDGLPDVIIAEQEQSSSDRLAIYYNHGGGLAWTEQVIANVGGHNGRIADIDADGDLDILNVNHGFFGEPNPIEVFWNTSASETTPPVISDLVTSVEENSAALTWSTDEPATARIDVSSGSALPRSFVRTSFREQHIIVLTGLACATSYDLSLEVVDSFANATQVIPAGFTTNACGSSVGAVTADLLALYEFDEGSGTSVADTSGTGSALDLTIDDPLGVTWLPGALRISTPVSIASAGAATKIIDAAQLSGGISIEAWIDPEASQANDATLLSIDGAGQANVRFEQGPFTNQPVFRLALRTQTSDASGFPGVDGPLFAPSTELTHAVFTHGADGITRLYLDGVPMETNATRQASPLTGWDPTYGLVLANRDGGGEPWVGDVHRIAVYGRALTADEVLRNYAVGPGPAACEDGIDNDGDGAIDAAADAGCLSAGDASERETGLACDDGLDGDSDGAVDFPADSGCEDAAAPDENEAPMAADDLYRTPPGIPLSETPGTGVLVNDLDSEGSALGATLESSSSDGFLSFSSDGSFDYTPDPGFVGIDAFTYRADDGAESSGVANARLVVAPENAPAALDDSYGLEPDESLIADAASGVLANDDDPQGIETLTTELLVGADHGILVLQADGAFDYTPDPGYAGVDTFRYRADDGSALSNAADVTLRVAPIAQAPAAHWRFDEGSGPDAVDSTGNGNDGSLSGPVWSLDTPTGEGAALDFDGSDDRVALGAFDVPSQALTLAAFLKPDDFGVNDARLISKATGTATNDHVWMLGLTSTGGENRLRFRLTAGGSTTTLVADSGDLVAGQWVHAAAVFDGSVMTLYLDGVPVGQQSKSGAIASEPAVDAAIGNQPAGAGNRAFDGHIDDARVYGVALTPAAIKALASGLGDPFTLTGVAQGGSVSIVVEDVEISVITQSGQSAAAVIDALAAAINANASLAALGITAHTDGGGLVSNGLVVAGTIGDVGFGGGPPPVPGLVGAGVALLVGLLAANGLWRTRRQRAG